MIHVVAISRVTGLNLTILLGDTQVIEATWNPLTEDISAYAIFVNSTSGEDFTFEVPSSQTSFNLTSVEAGFEYRFEVAGRREDDLGPNGIKSIQSYDGRCVHMYIEGWGEVANIRTYNIPHDLYT